jgi:hypothetical protein
MSRGQTGLNLTNEKVFGDLEINNWCRRNNNILLRIFEKTTC